MFEHYMNQLRLWCKYPVVSTEFVNAMNVSEHYIRTMYGDWMIKALDTLVANEKIETLQITPETYDEVTLN